jgi:hypothetical protein
MPNVKFIFTRFFLAYIKIGYVPVEQISVMTSSVMRILDIS